MTKKVVKKENKIKEKVAKFFGSLKKKFKKGV